MIYRFFDYLEKQFGIFALFSLTIIQSSLFDQVCAMSHKEHE